MTFLVSWLPEVAVILGLAAAALALSRRPTPAPVRSRRSK